MNAVSKTRLLALAAGHASARRPLLAWHKAARLAVWAMFVDVRATFGSADAVGDCVVFDIGGNNFRLVTRIRYPGRRVYVLRVMTHAEYDRDDWADDCGCYRPPPKRRRPGVRGADR